MMQTMRKSAKIIFFFVLVTFVGFMAYSGVVTSMASKSRNKGAGAPPGVIGIVNGTEISNYEFDEAFRKRLQSMTTDENPEPSEAEMEQARNEIWNNMTTMTLLQQEADKHGIEVTDREVANYMRQAPPRDVIESPDFATEGQFDITKYQGWLQQLANTTDPRARAILADFDTQIRQQLLVSRIQDYVLSMVRVTEADVKKDFIDKNDKVNVKYIFIPAGDFDSTITTVPESEVRARYEKDIEQFKQPEMATFDYVQLAKTPSEADKEEARTAINEIYNDLKNGADFAQTAIERSEDPGSGKNGGDLGWFGEGRMVAEFWEATKRLEKVGDMSAPFTSAFGWHIVKLTGKRTTKDEQGVEKPEYQASHILVRLEPSTETITQLEQTATNFRNDAEKLGFKEAALEYGMEITETKPFAAGTAIPVIGPNESLNKFAFEGKIGEISDPVSTRNAYFVMQIKKRSPAGYTPFEDAKDRVEKAVLRDKRVEMAHQRGEELAKSAGGKTIEELSAITGKPVMETGFFSRSTFVPKVGNDADFTGAAFSLSPERPMSQSVNTRTGAYILWYVAHESADTSSFAATSDSLTTDMITTKKRELWNKWLGSLKQNAKIEDYRSVYYGS